MGQFNGQPYSSTKNLNVKSGLIRFAITNASNKIGSGSSDYGLYVNADGSLVFSSAGSITVIGAPGAGSGVTTWDGLYSNDKTLAISGTTLTFDGTHASNNAVTFTMTGAGTGHAVQITNVGTGKDINGTNDTWSISKVGDAVFNKVTFAGDADSASFTLTIGDFAVSDGKVAITNADNEATLVVTNNGLTSFPALELVGSGAFTGDNTSAFAQIRPTGLTTGTALYVVTAALTTGTAINVVANAVTDGLVVDITSSSTVHTATGRLLNVASTAATNTNAVLNEFATAANDETVLLRLTASDVLAAGKILHISASGMTTGTAIDAAALDGVTTGIGISIASTSTTLTTGSLIRVSTGTTGAVATNGVVSITATAAYTSTSNAGLLNVVANSVTTGATIVNISGTAATTSVLLNIANGTAATTSGSLLRVTAGGIRA